METIFVHGLGQNATSWDHTIRLIGEKKNINCPDLQKLIDGKLVNYENLYAAFKQYCLSFDEKLDLCGLSLGGMLSLQFAIEYPTRVHSLILIGTQYILPKILFRLQNIIFRFMPASLFEDIGFCKSDFIGLSKSMVNLDFSNSLNKISCPALVLCGEKDRANKKASIQLAKNILAKYKEIEHAGHEVNIQAPELLAAAIEEFYKDISN